MKIMRDRAITAGLDELARLGLVAGRNSVRDDLASLALLPVDADSPCSSRDLFVRSVLVPAPATFMDDPRRSTTAVHPQEKSSSEVAGHTHRLGWSRGGRTTLERPRQPDRPRKHAGAEFRPIPEGCIMTRNLLTIATAGL